MQCVEFRTNTIRQLEQVDTTATSLIAGCLLCEVEMSYEQL